MREQTKPIGDEITETLQLRPARLKRDNRLKKKIVAIIKEHPNRSLGVIRRWLHGDLK